jgi:hypothetical protein
VAHNQLLTGLHRLLPCDDHRFGFSDRNMLVLRDDVRQQGFVSDRWVATMA